MLRLTTRANLLPPSSIKFGVRFKQPLELKDHSLPTGQLEESSWNPWPQLSLPMLMLCQRFGLDRPESSTSIQSELLPNANSFQMEITTSPESSLEETSDSAELPLLLSQLLPLHLFQACLLNSWEMEWNQLILWLLTVLTDFRTKTLTTSLKI